MRILRFLFPPEWLQPAVPCREAADANDDGKLDISDPVYILSHLFRGGPAPPAPFPDCGDDPTAGELGCGESYVCALDGPTLYGLRIEADGFFFIVDRYEFIWGSGELAIAKREILRVISTAKPEVELGIAFSDGGVLRFRESGVPFAAGDGDAVRRAYSFLQSTPGGDANACVRDGLLAGIAFAEASTASRRVVIYIGTGRGACHGGDEAEYLRETLNTATAAIAGRFPLHAIGENVRSPSGDQFLRDLAAQNDGTYTRIER